MIPLPFKYSNQFMNAIIQLHEGSEKLPSYENYINSHLGGLNSRLTKFIMELCPEIQYRCGSLRFKRILDYGCGTGATTAALAQQCSEIVALDIDQRILDICQQRIFEHGYAERVKFKLLNKSVSKMAKLGRFDFILMNGVIEHIPMTIRGLRSKILRRLFDLLHIGGHIYINETPNRLWPYDFHTTQLWWIPWTSPGSMSATRKAIQKKRHVPNKNANNRASREFEKRGSWGATYFEINNYLSGKKYRILNTDKKYARHIKYFPSNRKKLEYALDFIGYHFFTRGFNIPITALSPYLSHLVFQKMDD